MAWFFSWKTGDLVWSLWLGSLVIGYITILCGIGYLFLAGTKLSNLPDENIEKHKGKIRGVSIGLAAFLLVFFSFHFCGFHAGHAGFLQSFFPIDGISEGAFTQNFANPIGLWKLVITELIPIYGIFLLPIAITERHNIFKKPDAYRHITSGIANHNPKHLKESSPKSTNVQNGAATDNPHHKRPVKTLKNRRHEKYKKFGRKHAQEGSSTALKTKDLMTAPYINVLRMHLLIFVFAASSYLALDNFILYAIVYAVYFFPWRHLKGESKSAAVEPSKVSDT